MNTSDSTNRTVYNTPGLWCGIEVRVESDDPCPVSGHDLEQVEHYDTGPTGFLMCRRCLGFADDPSYTS